MFHKRTLLFSTIFLTAMTLEATYPLYKNITVAEKQRIQRKSTSGSYLSQMYIDNIRTPVKSILELGSRDAIDALKLSEHYKCHVFAFECNPEGISACKQNIGNNPNVTLVPAAVWDTSGPISFFPMVETPGVFYNPGSSSCFQVDRNGHHKTYVQKEITVPAVRLDEWLERQGIDSIDMLCMDVQGAALQALKGMGKYLNNVQYIITEIEHDTIYTNEALYSEVEQFLEEHGFRMYVGTINMYFGDYLFVRKDLIQKWEALN